MIHLDYRDARPIYSQIEGGIREQILAGILQPGDKLPSVRVEAGELGVNLRPRFLSVLSLFLS